MTDRMYGIELKDDVTQFLTRYFDLLRCFRRANTSNVWIKRDFLIARDKLVRFEALGKSVFGGCQPSGMGTQKWHPLEHLTYAIRHIGGVECLHEGMYEGCRNILKSRYAKGSH